MSRDRVLVAGLGNIFLGDDGFGVEVVRRLALEPKTEGVRVEDFGIRGMHLAYELMGGAYETAILVDATSRGGAAGTLYVIEPEVGATRLLSDEIPADAHAMSPDAVLRWLRNLGGEPPRLLVVGCEPASLEEEMGLSEPVSRAVDEAVSVVKRLASEETKGLNDSGRTGGER
jgi:hydrogenase maturation protease